MKDKIINNRHVFYLYYAVLVLIMTSWRSQDTAPNVVLRLFFLAAVILPVFFSVRNWFPAVIACFVAMTEYGFAYSYMPTMYYYYVGVAVLALIVMRKTKQSPPSFLIFFLIYTFLIDFIYTIRIENIHYCLFIIISFCLILPLSEGKGVREVTNSLSLAFAVSTLVLSLFFLFMREDFAMAYGGYGSDLERTLWTDPNYFGMILGMGVTSSIIRLFRGDQKGLWVKIFFIAVIVIAIPTLILNASRGALLAVGLTGIVALLFSKQKMYIRIGIVIAIISFLIYLFNNDYFELLEYRLGEDEGTGSGRVTIWMSKWEAFTTHSNPLQLLFGWGYWDAYSIGSSRVQGFHNDYLAFLVGYGIVGFLMFVYLLLKPYFSIKKKNTLRVLVLIATVYLMANGLTLEPLDQGRLPFWCFYFYIITLSADAKINSYSNYEIGNY